jgi:hypothetical protein
MPLRLQTKLDLTDGQRRRRTCTSITRASSQEWLNTASEPTGHLGNSRFLRSIPMVRVTILRGRVSDTYFRVTLEVGPPRQRRLIEVPKLFAGYPPPRDSIDRNDDAKYDLGLESILSNMADFQNCFRTPLIPHDIVINSPLPHRKPRILHISVRIMLRQSCWRAA